jgi:predicted nucleotidyltransferase
MNRKPAKLKSLLVRRIRAAGLDWEQISYEARQIIIFGSYALDSNKRGSDLDVLCVGGGQPFKSTALHILWVTEKKLLSPVWQKSELATHIAVYGKWIKGNNDWAHWKKPGRLAVARKKQNILARINAMNRHWDKLLPNFQNRQLIMLRRDLQRYRMLRQGLAPIPKPLLDSEWKRNSDKRSWVKLLGFSADISKPIRAFFQTHEIGNQF